MSENSRSDAPEQGGSASAAQASTEDTQSTVSASADGTSTSMKDDSQPAPGSADDSAGNGSGESADDSASEAAVSAAQSAAEPAADGTDPSDAESEAEADPGSPLEQQFEQQLEALEAENAKLAREKQENWDRMLRATADLENFRRRARRDLEDTKTESRTKVLREMLPVIDNLERAVAHAESSNAGTGDNDGDGNSEVSAAVASVVDGVKLVLRQFAQALERCDVTPVDAVGKPFDPNVHEAISQIETGDHASGSVVQVLQKGYMIGSRLLRPSLVVVAKAPATPAPAAPTDGDGDGDGDGGDGTDAGGEA